MMSVLNTSSLMMVGIYNTQFENIAKEIKEEQMLEVLEFIFQDIIHFIGTILLLETIGNMFKKNNNEQRKGEI